MSQSLHRAELETVNHPGRLANHLANMPHQYSGDHTYGASVGGLITASTGDVIFDIPRAEGPYYCVFMRIMFQRRATNACTTLNGANGEATNTDDVNRNDENKRMRREANTQRYRQVADGRHTSVTPGPAPNAIPANTNIDPVITDDVRQATVTQPLPPPKITPTYFPDLCQREIFYVLPQPSWVVVNQECVAFCIFAWAGVLHYYGWLSDFWCLVIFAIAFIIFINRYTAEWFRDIRLHTFHSITSEPYHTPPDHLEISWFPRLRQWNDVSVTHHTSRDFNASSHVTVCRALLACLAVKHPLASPTEHSIQQFVASLTSHFGAEIAAEHQELFIATCEVYYQDMLRHHARRKLLGVRLRYPSA